MKDPHYVLAFMFTAAIGIAYALIGCGASMTPSESAGAGYAAQHMACVDTYADKHNIDACRAKVRAAWGVEAGTDGFR